MIAVSVRSPSFSSRVFYRKSNSVKYRCRCLLAHPCPAFELRQSPGSENGGGDQQNTFATFVHGVRHLETRWSTSRRPTVRYEPERSTPILTPSSGCKMEVYHFRFLFAIGKCTGARGQIGALGGCDRRPEWTAGWYKKLWVGCETVEWHLAPVPAPVLVSATTYNQVLGQFLVAY